MRTELWYKNAVIYAVDVSAFADSNGDGIGDFQGLISRLDHLAGLGVTCLWMLPFFSSPRRDNGYDIADYFGIDPRFGTLDDFIEFLHRAGELGIRVIIDLVMNHTSDKHPWFQAGRRTEYSRYRNYYVWIDAPPPTPPGEGTIFPGQENSVWTFDEVAGRYFYHKFYHFQPDLNLSNPQVREEIHRVLDYWMSFGISGFRVDAAPHMIEKNGIPGTEPTDPHGVLKEMRAIVTGRRPDAVLLGESDVEPEKLATYFGDGDEFSLLFNFFLDNYIFLALARQEADPLMHALRRLPTVPEVGQWANFLRNLDELDLERLPAEEREEVYAAFAPEEEMRIYNRGIRRRIGPMMGGDRRRLEMAFSLLFSLPGTPVIVYGDEIGMGEDLSLKGRNAVRTPMQWSAKKNAGFSDAPAKDLERPVIADGPFDYKQVNVADQREDPGSLLSWMKRLILLRRQCPELGLGVWHTLPLDNPGVLAHLCEWKGQTTAAVHNLMDTPCSITLDLSDNGAEALDDLFGEGEWEPLDGGQFRVELAEYGYRWFRLRMRGEIAT